MCSLLLRYNFVINSSFCSSYSLSPPQNASDVFSDAASSPASILPSLSNNWTLDSIAYILAMSDSILLLGAFSSLRFRFSSDYVSFPLNFFWGGLIVLLNYDLLF